MSTEAMSLTSSGPRSSQGKIRVGVNSGSLGTGLNNLDSDLPDV